MEQSLELSGVERRKEGSFQMKAGSGSEEQEINNGQQWTKIANIAKEKEMPGFLPQVGRY